MTGLGDRRMDHPLHAVAAELKEVPLTQHEANAGPIPSFGSDSAGIVSMRS